MSKKWLEEFNAWKDTINWESFKSREDIDIAIIDKLCSMLNERETNNCFICGNELSLRYFCEKCNDASHPVKK